MSMRKLMDVFPDAESLPQVNLKPGQVVIASKPTIISTLLGSCVSVVIYHLQRRVVAVSHSLLPYQVRGGDMDPFRYVDSSLKYMLDKLSGPGIKHSLFKVKLFGGAEVANIGQGPGVDETSIGSQNIRAARKILSNYGLPLTVDKVGGKKGYKLYIRSDTGEVLLRYLSKGKRCDCSSLPGIDRPRLSAN